MTLEKTFKSVIDF